MSAGMGGGHNGAASGLSGLLTAARWEPQVVDLLEMMRFGYGRLISGIYHSELRFAPWSYQSIYSAWRTHPTFVRRANSANTRAARKGLLGRVAQTRPAAVISAYNIGSQILGELTTSGELDVPAYSYVTDFGVHPYWIHEAISGYLAVHESSARRITSLSNSPVGVCGPLVAASFAVGPTYTDEARSVARRSLGFDDRDTVALVVAGAWGVGKVEDTVADLLGIDGCQPLIVCGTNHRLADRLRRKLRDPRHVLGFTDQMHELMNLADVLVENAGGMTSSEAFATKLPVITYLPIPGHGVDNAVAMAAAGVTTFARTRRDLVAALTSLKRGGIGRAPQIDAALKVFQADPTSVVLDLIAPAGPQ